MYSKFKKTQNVIYDKNYWSIVDISGDSKTGYLYDLKRTQNRNSESIFEYQIEENKLVKSPFQNSKKNSATGALGIFNSKMKVSSFRN